MSVPMEGGDPRERVLRAFAAALATAYGREVDRNGPEPRSLKIDDFKVNVLDGPESKPKTGHNGFILRSTAVTVEGYVKTPDRDPGPTVNALIATARQAVCVEIDSFPPRTLGGVLVGEIVGPPDNGHYDALEEGQLDVEIFRDGEHGAAFTLDYELQYATEPNDPSQLVRLDDPRWQ